MMASSEMGKGPSCTHVHCWVSDLPKMPVDEEEETAGVGVGRRKDPPPRPKTVCLMGVVVGASAPGSLAANDGGGKRQPVAYHLDDGTGVARVVHFLGDRLRRQDDAGAMERLDAVRSAWSGDRLLAKEGGDCSVLRRSLADMLRETRRMAEESRSEFPVGTCVEARGRLQRFRGEVEVLAFSVRKVQDPAAEVERTTRVERMRREGVYPEHWFR